MSLAGTPPMMLYGATSLVTTAPAAMTDPVPMVTPGKIVARAPSHTLSSMTTGEWVMPCSLIGFCTSEKV